MRTKVMKGATATLSYAFTEGDPLTLTVHRIGMKRYSRQSGVSGAFIALTSAPRAAVLTASATPVTITTTNIPGALAFTCEADAAALGTRAAVVSEDFAYPLAVSAQATATTIVCPATTGVIWRVTAGYYAAP